MNPTSQGHVVVNLLPETDTSRQKSASTHKLLIQYTRTTRLHWKVRGTLEKTLSLPAFTKLSF